MPSVNTLSIITSVVVTFVGVIIACFQYRVAREKLRQDYFERRFKIYFAFATLIATSSGEIDGDLAPLFQEASRANSEARFLFGSEIAPYLNQLYREAFAIWQTPRLFDTAGSYSSPKERAEAWSKHQAEKMNFGTRMEGLITVFEPYLRADEWLLKRSSAFPSSIWRNKKGK